jgi:hypothetical protein
MDINISQRAMLAYISISAWSGMKLDKKASSKVTDDAGAVTDAARVNKRLLAGADAKLTAIRRIDTNVRRYLDAETLPWDDAGNRLLPNTKAFAVMAKVAEFRKEFNDAVDAFVEEYPILRQQALASLGDLADTSDYPPTDQVRGRFAFRVTFSPMPASFTGDVRYGLTPEQVSALESAAASRVREQVETALRTAIERLLHDVRYLAERMRRGDDGKYPIFRDGTIDNVRATAEALGPLNVFGDPDLERIRQRVLAECCLYSPTTLRNMDTARDETAAKAQALVDDMLGMLGE